MQNAHENCDLGQLRDERKIANTMGCCCVVSRTSSLLLLVAVRAPPRACVGVRWGVRA